MSQQTTAAQHGEDDAPAREDAQHTAETSRARDLVQSIVSDYFNISDGAGRPVASLIVLVDRARVPVRAELHLNGNPGEEVSRQCVRQAQHILEERYRGPETLPMQVWQSIPRSDPLPVPLPPADEKARVAGGARATSRAGGLTADTAAGKAIPWQPFAIGVAALALVALIWGLISWVRPDTPAAEGPTSGGVTETVEGALPEGDLAPVEEPMDTGGAAQDPGAAIDAAAEPAESDLPTSRFAHPELTRGMRVRIIDTKRLTLRSEPGANAGEAVGYMQNGQEAEIIGGPRLLQGNSDTIVWWEVRLDDGNIAWAAANTSEETLLEPAD